MKIQIALLVGSNGKCAANAAGDVDWGLLADCIMDWERGKESKDPEVSVKYIVEVDVPLPSMQVVEGSLTALA